MDFGNNDDIFKFLMSRSGKINSNGFGNTAISAYGNTASKMGNSAMKIPNSNTQALSNQNMQMASTGATSATGGGAKGGKGSFLSGLGGGGGQGGYVGDSGSIDSQTQEQMNGALSGLNNVPIVGWFKGLADGVENIGGAIGGEKGSNVVQSFTNPLGRAMEVWKNPNYSKGQKALAGFGLLTAPFLSFLKPKAVIDNPEQDRMNKLRDYQLNKIKENNFLKSSDFYKGMLN